jgi:hypothetical protein
MKDHRDNTAIACSLSVAELRGREAKLLAQFRSAAIEIEELEEGYAFRLPDDGRWIGLIEELIVAERECCAFLAFEVSTLPNMGPVIVRVTGPTGAKEFLSTMLCEPESSNSQDSGRTVAGLGRKCRQDSS